MNRNAFPRVSVVLVVALVLAAGLLRAEPAHAAPSLTINPTSALPNQAISLTGAGFSTGSGVTIGSITLGGVLLPSSKINTANPVQVDSSGNFVAIVLVPVDGTTLAPGIKSVVATDSKGAQASANLTIPSPSISVDPATSRAATSVTVTGANYHVASSRAGADYTPAVNVYYDNNSGLSSKLVATAAPDSAGTFKVTFDVPVSAAVGLKNTIRALIVGGPATGPTTTHTVPAPVMSISPTAGAPETTVTVTGVDLPAFTQVKDLAFAHVGQLSATPVFTDASGKVTLTLKAPLLENGTYPVRVQVGETSYIVAFTLQGSWYTPPAPPPPPPLSVAVSEGLTPLGDNLVRAWHLDNSTKQWAFYDPAPTLAGLSTLANLVDGRVYWVRLKDDQTAQLNGKQRTLFQGWNLIPW